MKRLLVPLQDAFSFLTILPVGSRVGGEEPSVRMSRALAWFPLVGLALGLAASGATLAAGNLWSWPVASGLGLLILSLLTGGLHLDGFADTVDGLAGGRDQAHSREIMKEPQIGTFAAAGLVFLLGLQWMILHGLNPRNLLGIWATACLLSRWGMVLSAQWFPYAPGKGGVGSWVTERQAPYAIAWATLLAIGGTLLFWDWRRTLLWMGVTVLGVLIVNRWMVARLGGITGDTLGALNELLTTLLLLAMTTG